MSAENSPNPVDEVMQEVHRQCHVGPRIRRPVVAMVVIVAVVVVPAVALAVGNGFIYGEHDTRGTDGWP